MSIKLQALILAVLILISVTITRIGNKPPTSSIAESSDSEIIERRPSGFSYEGSLFLTTQPGIKKAPSRNWDVLDPDVQAEAVLVHSLDDNFPFFNYNTYKSWPMASLTKLLTALVVLEDIGENKKIPIDEAVVAEEGGAGNLRSGEVFTARDLLKIMLITSSNDAAYAFEKYLGEEEFLRLMNQKIRKIEMSQTVVLDSSGLNDSNRTTASDLVRLGRYILENEPNIFNWSRVKSQLVQPLNDTTSRTIFNVNNLVDKQYFLGGKTGTSLKARENLLTVVSLENTRLLMVILGSHNRKADVDLLLNWINEAYNF